MSTLQYDLATVITVRSLTQPVTCKMGSSIFAAMTWLKVASTTSASLPIILYTEISNEEKNFLWSQQAWPYLSLLSLSQPANNLSILTGLQESASASPKLTPIISSVWLSHRFQIYTPPRISRTLPLQSTSSCGILRPNWIRGFLRTQLGEKACFARWIILSHISLWRVMNSPSLGQISALCTKIVCMKPLQFFAPDRKSVV